MTHLLRLSTKGAFFYHFKSKADLAHGLMKRFAEQDITLLEDSIEKVESINDPRKRLLAFVDEFINAFADIKEPPGCLYASYIYEPEQFSKEIKDMVANAIIIWRKGIVRLLDDLANVNRPAEDYDADSLADMFTVIIEGAFIVSKALNAPKLTAIQLRHYRTYLELIFSE